MDRDGKVCLANQVGRKNLFSRSADGQVKRMRTWFWSRWPIHQTRYRSDLFEFEKGCVIVANGCGDKSALIIA
jgi:hypothetical protein